MHVYWSRHDKARVCPLLDSFACVAYAGKLLAKPVRMQRTAPLWKTRSLFGCLPLKRSLALLYRRLLRTGEMKPLQVNICCAVSPLKLRVCLPACSLPVCLLHHAFMQLQGLRHEGLDIISSASPLCPPCCSSPSPNVYSVSNNMHQDLRSLLVEAVTNRLAYDLQWPRLL